MYHCIRPNAKRHNKIVNSIRIRSVHFQIVSKQCGGEKVQLIKFVSQQIVVMILLFNYYGMCSDFAANLQNNFEGYTKFNIHRFHWNQKRAVQCCPQSTTPTSSKRKLCTHTHTGLYVCVCVRLLRNAKFSHTRMRKSRLERSMS